MAKRTRRESALSFEDLMSIDRVSRPDVSPDGRRFVFVATRYDSKTNTVRHTLRLFEFDTREITELTPGSGNSTRPAWSPDGKWIAFVGDRDDEGEQIWLLPVAAGEAHRITAGPGGAGTPVWAADSRRIAFSRHVVVSPHCATKRTAKGAPIDPPPWRVHGLSNPESSARIADDLLFRHWDEWRDHRRNHIFLVDRLTGRMNDITPHPCDAPPVALGSDIDYRFSPEGNEIAFVMNPDEVVARSTNNCIFLQKLRGLRAVGDPVSISTSEACDHHPVYFPDGSGIAYLAMDMPGYEADRNRIKVYHRATGKTETLLERFDRSPSTFQIAPDGGIVFSAVDRGRQSLYRIDRASRDVRQLTGGIYNGVFRLIPGDRRILVTRESTTEPADFHLVDLGESFRPDLSPGPGKRGRRSAEKGISERLTRYGDAIAHVKMNDAEEFWYPGAGGTPVHGFLIRPPRFRKGRKYPLILLIHGGPQSAFLDHFHYRWNAQYFAKEGAAVAFLNPRGSVGYGQRFTDEISRDWGGKCYRDIMLGVDFLLKEFPFIDGDRMAAAGASFGGFMINWIAGHTDRFRALVCHDGIFHSETMAYTTEELWFEEREHGGFPHTNRKAFNRFSPHRFVGAFRTPMLVVHGGKDYRCPVSEGIGMYTALQLMGVESRFLYFPDEGHWVLRPANSEVWYDEVLSWMMKRIAK